MAFWTHNSYAPSWSQWLSHMWSGDPPKLCDSAIIPRRLKATPGLIVSKVVYERELEDIPEFWSRWFSVSKSCRCMVPLQHLRKQWGRWEIWTARKADGELVGTVVRRWFKDVRMFEVVWPKLAVVDFFCIHPAWRKRGLGRELLTRLHNATPAPFSPHMILWEGLQLSMPPLAVGWWWSKKCVPGEQKAVPAAWNMQMQMQMQMQKGTAVDIASVTDSEASEVSTWRVGPHHVTVWNTFHRSVPDGAVVGIILKATAEGADLFSESSGHPFGVLLSQSGSVSSSSGWESDSPFQWIGYNLSCGKISTQFPCLAF